jgi:GT2 family glycosyltransferase
MGSGVKIKIMGPPRQATLTLSEKAEHKKEGPKVKGLISVRSYAHRPRVAGKFLYVGDEKFWVKGVTYGTFRPDGLGDLYRDPETAAWDFTRMAANGVNALRTYTVPPLWLLNLAEKHGLRVMVGLPWEQHVAFLDDPGCDADIERRIRKMVRGCACHPAVLCYAVGNEIPASVVRWSGGRRVERFIERLYSAVKDEDADGLVTYVNYPTTEYLQLPFVDFVSFNVYLESQDRLDAYLARLHNLAGDRPLLMAEIGLDSRRNGEEKQAQVLDWQVRTAFAAGCAGTFVFAWTDEWHRGGYEIEDWDFGLIARDGRPKAALEAVRRAFEDAPLPRDTPWPRISVVVCSCNGARTIRDTCEGLAKLDYPDYEVIIVDDGSKDATAAIARDYGFRVISTERRGLSSARNTGMEAASGEIIAYIDDDAYPDPHWLSFLAHTFMNSDHAGVGGPNIAPPTGDPIADCSANAPGGPVHVLLSDRVAEHIPGCNMAFRTSCLRAVGGFDPRFCTAGDDVDICWRLQDRGWTIGFAPAAMDWHHRRNSIRMYWKQQVGYGKAEALLEEKWPEKYNAIGHFRWTGRLYGKGLTRPLNWRERHVYQGSWGMALFQSIYQPAPGLLLSLPLMPEWYLVVALLAGLSLLGQTWHPLHLTVPLLMLAVGALLLQAVLSASKAHFTSKPATRLKLLKLYAITALFHLMQPLARLIGRLHHGLTPWRRRGVVGYHLAWEKRLEIWTETRASAEQWLHALEHRLRASGTPTLRGGDFDSWDLEVRCGPLGSARVLLGIEEHGGGKQMARFRLRLRLAPLALWPAAIFGLLAIAAARDGAWLAGTSLALAAVLPLLKAVQDGAASMQALGGEVRNADENGG